MANMATDAAPGAPMTSIRVLIGPMPQMLRAIIEELLSHEPDLAIVGSSTDPSLALRDAREVRADILITQSAELGQETCLEAVAAGPPFSILAIDRSGQEAAVTKVVRRPIGLSESNSGIAAAIRHIAADLDPQARPGEMQWLG